MALPVDFMQRVIDWPGLSGPGFVNLHWTVPPTRGHGVRGRPYKEAHDFMNDAQVMAAQVGKYKEIYFCLSVQKDTGGLTKFGLPKAHRHASKALSLKALWIDIDCGHGKDYPTQAEAIDALTQFVAAEDLPSPTAIVNSGGGVHAYWISQSALTPEQWRPYAEGLKSLVIQRKLCKDAGLIADQARILRVPGTFNNKIEGLPRPVRLLHLAATDYDFAVEPRLARLATLVKVAPAKITAAVTASAPALELPAAFASGPASAFAALDASADRLNAGIERRDLSLPLLVDQAIVKCQHFRDCATTHGMLHGQGLWALTLLACTFVEDGEAWARNFSKGYPTYSAEETDAKFAEKERYKAENDLGWPSCSAFEGEGAKCAGCPFKGVIQSPLALCDRQDPPPPPPVAFAQAEAEAELDLPQDYTLNSDGIICEIVEKVDPKTEATSTEYVPLFLCKLRNFRAQSGVRLLLFETSLDMHRWGGAQLSEAEDFINDTAIVKALRRYGVKPNTKLMMYPKRITTFMTSFMAKLDRERERQRAIPFGWLHADEENVHNKLPLGFAYGGRVCMADGTDRPAGYADPILAANYTPKGAADPWWDMLHMVTAQHHPALEAIVSVSFAAPLMTAVGLYNGVVCAWSPESGARKSTSVQIGSSVWGNPKLTKERPLSTQKGVLHRLGTIKSLPVYWDEINDVTKMDDVRQLLGVLTEGSRGSAQRQDGTARQPDEWQTCMMVGANNSLVDNIFNNVKDTDAQLERVFEFQVEWRLGPGVGPEIDLILNSLDRNYGQIGLAYSEFLGRNIEMVFEFVKNTRIRFEQEVGASNKERFRAGLAAAMWAGAYFANKLGTDFNLDELWDYLKLVFKAQSEKIRNSAIVAGTVDNTADAMSQFIKRAVANTLWVKYLLTLRPGQHDDAVVYIAGPRRDHPAPIHIRFSVDDRIMEVSKSALLDYLEQHKHNSQAVLRGLRAHYKATEVKRIGLAIGSGISGGKETILRVPVPPGSPWESDLYTHTPLTERGVTAPVTTGVVAAAAAQAAKDLAVVQGATP